MANRHLARSLVMQTLFSIDFNNLAEKDALKYLQYNVQEFAPGFSDTAFMERLLAGTIKKRSIIDDIIGKAAPEWPVPKINAVDRNVLRLGLFELLFGDYTQVPPKVAINEAIELAKSFGGESSGRFVNGVLGAVYREIGEPGKDQKSRRQREKEIDISKLPVEHKAGAIVHSVNDEGEKVLAMVHDVFGFWTLSKGGVDPSLSLEEGCAKKIKEETNLDISVEKKIGENEYLANDPEKGKIRKHVTYFLASSEYVEPKLPEDAGGLDDVRWFTFEEILDLRMYEDITKLITSVIEELMD